MTQPESYLIRRDGALVAAESGVTIIDIQCSVKIETVVRKGEKTQSYKWMG